jgi:hypothetical protein
LATDKAIYPALVIIIILLVALIIAPSIELPSITSLYLLLLFLLGLSETLLCVFALSKMFEELFWPLLALAIVLATIAVNSYFGPIAETADQELALIMGIIPGMFFGIAVFSGVKLPF